MMRQMTGIADQLPQYQQLDSQQTALNQVNLDIKETENNLTRQEAALAHTAKQLQEGREEWQRLQSVPALLVSLTSQIEKLNDRARQADKLNSFIAEYSKQKAALFQVQADYEQAARAEDLARQEYHAKNRAFLNAQAGILARGLQPDTPCPVCGSLSHPAPAPLPQDAPSEDVVEAAKTRMEQNAATAARHSKDAAGKLSALTARESDIKAQGQALGLDEKSKLRPQLMVLLDALKTEQEQKKAALEVAKAQDTRRQALDTLLPGWEKDLDSARAQVNALTLALTTLKTKQSGLMDALADLRARLPYADAKAAQTQHDLLQTRQAAIIKQAEDSRQAIIDHEKQTAQAQSRVNTFAQQLSDSPVIDAILVTKQARELTDEEGSIKNALLTLHTRLKTNKQAQAEMTRLQADQKAVHAQWTFLKTLSDTANGLLPGKERVMLEAFAQGFYFDRVLARANIRFMTMSDGQYELRRTDTAGDLRRQSGLDLQVLDHYNGSLRDVASLSGGESFMAALSLALGLSDEIQSASGGIHLSTMFVDEGFGSLDPTALSQSIKALSTLSKSHVLVGIISHVAELRERIDKQIIITKDRAGGSQVDIIA